MNKFCPLIALAVVALIQVASAQGLVELNTLCSNKTVEINKISQMVDIVEEAHRHKPGDVFELDPNQMGKCDEPILTQIQDLKPLITENMDNVCSLEKARQFVVYFDKYLAEGSVLPTSVKDFFYDFGLMVNSKCKGNLMEVLSNSLSKPDRILGEEATNAFFGDDGLVNSLVPNPGYTNLVENLALSQVVLDAKEEAAEPLSRSIDASGAVMFKKLRENCVRNLRPIYWPLLEPLVTMANANLNQAVDKNVDHKTNRDGVKHWLKVINMCEALLQFKFDDNEKDGRVQMIYLDNKEAVDQQIKSIVDIDRAGVIVRPPNDENRVTDDLIFGSMSTRQIVKSWAHRVFHKIKGAFHRNSNKSDREEDYENKFKALKKAGHMVYIIRNKCQLEVNTENIYDPKNGAAGRYNVHQFKIVPLKLLGRMLASDPWANWKSESTFEEYWGEG